MVVKKVVPRKDEKIWDKKKQEKNFPPILSKNDSFY